MVKKAVRRPISIITMVIAIIFCIVVGYTQVSNLLYMSPEYTSKQMVYIVDTMYASPTDIRMEYLLPQNVAYGTVVAFVGFNDKDHDNPERICVSNIDLCKTIGKIRGKWVAGRLNYFWEELQDGVDCLSADFEACVDDWNDDVEDIVEAAEDFADFLEDPKLKIDKAVDEILDETYVCSEYHLSGNGRLDVQGLRTYEQMEDVAALQIGLPGFSDCQAIGFNIISNRIKLRITNKAKGNILDKFIYELENWLEEFKPDKSNDHVEFFFDYFDSIAAIQGALSGDVELSNDAYDPFDIMIFAKEHDSNDMDVTEYDP